MAVLNLQACSGETSAFSNANIDGRCKLQIRLVSGNEYKYKMKQMELLVKPIGNRIVETHDLTLQHRCVNTNCG